MQKRRVDTNPSDTNKKQNKRIRVFNARLIRADTTNSSFFKDGKLDVPAFVNSRRFEIDQLERSQLGSKNSQSTRVFQSLPRKLRRRNASHNVKRIPKRLRNRAIREMLSSKSKDLKFKSDLSDVNTKNLTNKRKGKYNAKSIYKLKQRRTLLKLAAKWKLRKYVPASLLGSGLNLRKMIKALKAEVSSSKISDDLQKHLIPVTSNYGSYDNSGINKVASPLAPRIKYLKRSKNFAWLSTHIWHAKRFHMLKRWGWNIPYKPTQKCFRLVHRNLKNTGGIVVDTSYESKIIIKNDIKEYERAIKCLEEKLIHRKINKSTTYYQGNFYKGDDILTRGFLFINVYENSFSALLQFHAADFQKVWSYLHDEFKEFVNDIIDCRYSLGSIDLLGPKSLESLVSSIYPIDKYINDKWGNLNKISDIHSFGNKSVMSFNITDPRYFKRKITRRNSKFNTNDLLDLIIDIKSKKWHSKEIVHDLFSSEGRTNSYKYQYTTKQINRMMKKLPSPDMVNLLRASQLNENASKECITLMNTKIPIMILFLEDRYKLVAPWFWITPIWQKLVKIPKMFPAGYIQLQQASMESNTPFYPNDYPTSSTGYIENELSGIASLESWKKKPKSKRMNYDNVLICNYDYIHHKYKGEVGDWNTCDWEFLRSLMVLHSIRTKFVSGAIKSSFEVHLQMAMKNNLKCLENLYSDKNILADIKMLTNMQLESMKIGNKQKFQVSRIPIIDYTERATEIFNNIIFNNIISNHKYTQIGDLRLPVHRVRITTKKNGKIKANCRIYNIPKSMLKKIKHHPNDPETINFDCPSFINLRGFITSSFLNLASSTYVGFGCISAIQSDFTKEDNYCILRNIGSKTCYIGCIDFIK